MVLDICSGMKKSKTHGCTSVSMVEGRPRRCWAPAEVEAGRCVARGLQNSASLSTPRTTSCSCSSRRSLQQAASATDVVQRRLLGLRSGPLEV